MDNIVHADTKLIIRQSNEHMDNGNTLRGRRGSFITQSYMNIHYTGYNHIHYTDYNLNMGPALLYLLLPARRS